MKVSMLLFLGIILLNCADEKRKGAPPLCSNKDFEFVVNYDTTANIKELIAISKKMGTEQILSDISTIPYTDYSQCECTDSTLLVSTKGLFVLLNYYQFTKEGWNSKDRKLLYSSTTVYLKGAYQDGDQVTDHQIFLEPNNQVRAVHTIKKYYKSEGRLLDSDKTESRFTLNLDEGKIQWPASERQ